MINDRVELLAPAGDLERLKIALSYGADAVYIGGPLLNLRANAVNFTFDDIDEGIKFAHNLNKKVYVTVNIVLHNKDAVMVKNYVEKLEELNVDGIIVSDPAVIKIAKENTNLDIILSTQQSLLNYEALSFYEKEGVKRVVLGRECTRDEIKELIEKLNMEIECFIHGAMCACYSGRCVMSNFLTNRDANRGGCAQICRWNFNLYDENKKEIKGDKAFTFCSKDLCMIEYIPDMIDIGIKSFKIEGRMRSAYYIATVVSTYRKVIDEYYENKENYKLNEEYVKILNRCANRDSIVQFYNGKYDSTCSYYNNRIEVSNQDFLGIVLDYDENTKLVTLEQRNSFKKGDEVVIFGPNHENISYKIDKMYDEELNEIDSAPHPRQIVKFYIDKKLDKNDMMRVKF